MDQVIMWMKCNKYAMYILLQWPSLHDCNESRFWTLRTWV